jgi:hypothetical protein
VLTFEDIQSWLSSLDSVSEEVDAEVVSSVSRTEEEQCQVEVPN